MKRGQRMFAKAAVLGAAVIVTEAAVFHAAVTGAGRWVREGQGAAVTRAAGIAAHAVMQGARDRVAEAMLESARFAARRGASADAFVLARSLRHGTLFANVPCERRVIVRAGCAGKAGARGLPARERALRSAVRKIEALQSNI